MLTARNRLLRCAAVVLVGLTVRTAPADAAGGDSQGLRVEPPKAIRTHTLVNQDGKSVAFPESGKWQLAFFGFSSCPDVCPATLQKAAQVLKRLGPGEAAGLEVVFLSIDSDRDQPEVVKRFVSVHDPRIQGLTGAAGAVQAVANEFGVIARRYQGKTALSYRIEHSAFLYLLDPLGRIVMLYPDKFGPEKIVADLRQLRTTGPGARR
jgi:protein SCO1/2